jgi:hypothetical protein
VGIINRQGRAFNADRSLLASTSEHAITFPILQVSTLENDEVMVPNEMISNAYQSSSMNTYNGTKIIAFSFKQYGRTLAMSWLEPLWNIYGQGTSSKIPIIELCFNLHTGV